MCKPLSLEERYQIHSLMEAKHTLTEIARLLGRDRSTIVLPWGWVEPPNRLRANWPISHETVYQHVDADKTNGGQAAQEFTQPKIQA